VSSECVLSVTVSEGVHWWRSRSCGRCENSPGEVFQCVICQWWL